MEEPAGYFMGGMPRSLQIFLTRRSMISVCRGTAERLFTLDYATRNVAPLL
jgi:hypothetical protein